MGRSQKITFHFNSKCREDTRQLGANFSSVVEALIKKPIRGLPNFIGLNGAPASGKSIFVRGTLFQMTRQYGGCEIYLGDINSAIQVENGETHSVLKAGRYIGLHRKIAIDVYDGSLERSELDSIRETMPPILKAYRQATMIEHFYNHMARHYPSIPLSVHIMPQLNGSRNIEIEVDSRLTFSKGWKDFAKKSKKWAFSLQ